MKRTKLKVGVIGCGAISDIYLKNMTEVFDNLEVTACAANHLEHAEEKARKYQIRALTTEALLADSSIDMVVVLTPAPTHYELIRRALLAGKHVYTEKTLTTSLETAKELLALADEKGLYLGAAPDTFLGASWQTARRLVDEQKIGEITSFVISANRNLDYLTSIFHFLRQPGGGICGDYGVYYLTALVALLGPAARVFAVIRNHKPVRTNIFPESSEYGKEFESPNESLVMAVIEMENGVTGTFSLNGESVQEDQAHYDIYGTKGILSLTDANQFGGKNRLILNSCGDQPAKVQEAANTFPYEENSRGIGPSEMADAICCGRANRASKELAYHVLDIISCMMKSSETGRFETVSSTCTRPEAMQIQ